MKKKNFSAIPQVEYLSLTSKCPSAAPGGHHWKTEIIRVSKPNCVRQSRSLLQEMSVLHVPWLTGAWLYLTCLIQHPLHLAVIFTYAPLSTTDVLDMHFKVFSLFWHKHLYIQFYFFLSYFTHHWRITPDIPTSTCHKLCDLCWLVSSLPLFVFLALSENYWKVLKTLQVFANWLSSHYVLPWHIFVQLCCFCLPEFPVIGPKVWIILKNLFIYEMNWARVQFNADWHHLISMEVRLIRLDRFQACNSGLD